MTDAAVGSVDPSCISDVCCYRQATRTLTRQGLCGTNVDSLAVDQVSCRTCFLPGLSCHSVTVTTHSSLANVHLSWYLLRSVCSRTCQVTTCIRFLGQLDYDLCTPAVNSMFSLAVCATRSPSFSPQARADMVCRDQITSVVAAQAGPLLPLTLYD